MPQPYHFHKDGKTDDGQEIDRFLTEGGKVSALVPGTYRIATGTFVGPGSLGVLPSNATYHFDASGALVLVVG